VAGREQPSTKAQNIQYGALRGRQSDWTFKASWAFGHPEWKPS